MNGIFAVGFSILLASSCLAARAQTPTDADPLRSLSLPAVPRQPWRFQQFPIIAWWGPPGTARLEDFVNYRDAGFTLCAVNPDSGYDQALNFAKRAGLPVMAYRQRQGFALPAPTIPVDFTKNTDDIVGWITNDEPSGTVGITDAITAVNTLIREDPTRRALFNMLPPDAQANPGTQSVIENSVRNGLPILSYDAYVIFANGSDNTVVYYRYLRQFREASLRYGVPFWAFALTIKHGPYRRPSESDVRWNQYSSLAYGAKGLWYFTYWCAPGWPAWDHMAIVDPKDGSKTDLYGWVKMLNHAVLGMGDILLHLTSTDVVHTKPPEGQKAFVPNAHWIADVHAGDALIGFFTDDRDGTEYALVVNKQHGLGKTAAETADDIELTFGPSVRSVTAVNYLDGKPGPLQISGGKASLRVSGGTGVLLRFDR